MRGNIEHEFVLPRCRQLIEGSHRRNAMGEDAGGFQFWPQGARSARFLIRLGGGMSREMAWGFEAEKSATEVRIWVKTRYN